jgi:YD repeat-containing protein
MNQKSIRVRCFALALLIGTANAFAQQHPNVKKGFSVDQVYQTGEIDNVNVFNGNLVVNIPIGQRYQVGGALSYGFVLNYNSKVWDYDSDFASSVNANTTMKLLPSRASNAGLGWMLSLGRILYTNNQANKSFGNVVYESPDGGQHRIYCTLHEDELPDNFCDDQRVDPNVTSGVQGYTRDGTYLRMKIVSPTRAVIEFPDGTAHYFDDDVAGSQMRITEMRDRFGNSVTISYPDALTWKITDSSTAGTTAPPRVHFVHFENVPQPAPTPQQPALPSNYKTRVSSVDVAGWNGSTSTYQFDYVVTGVKRGCVPQNFAPETTLDPRPSELTSITLPTGETYEFKYLNQAEHVIPDDRCGTGALKFIQFPTRGTIDYTYRTYELPTQGCTTEAALNETGGVSTRIFTDVARGTTRYKWTYLPQLPSTSTDWDCGIATSPFKIYTEATNLVTLSQVDTSTGRETVQKRVKHYFSVYPKQAASVPDGFTRDEYALPFTRRVKTTDGKFLSSETFDPSNLNQETSTFVTYEIDPKSRFDAFPPTAFDRNRRMNFTRTRYDDGKTADTKYELFDGLGHYRKVTTAGTFASGNDRTAITDFNPGKGMPSVPVPGNGGFFIPTIAHTAEWLLEAFDFQTVNEGTTTRKTEFCFDLTKVGSTLPTGFLKARRTLKGASATSNDLLAVFTQVKGSLATEKFYGGDKTGTSSSGCASNGETPQYALTHQYSFGSLKSTTYDNSGFLSLDSDIDKNTGLITTSRDSAGLSTGFTYDSLGRVKTVKPQLTGNGPSFSYTYKTDSRSPYVDVSASSSSGLAADRKFVRFDSLGRVWMEFDQLPVPGTWGVRTTEYDGLNRQTRAFEPALYDKPDPIAATLSSIQQTGSTSFTYDYMGRPASVTAPDQHTVSYSYKGISEATESTTRDNGNGSPERTAQTIRTYDRQGRLSKVDENVVSTSATALKGGSATTTYTYEPGGKLATVTMNGGSLGPQARSFEYDGRGLLTKETHPESGDTTYNNYDARGHAGRRINGGKTLRFEYDEAERLQEVFDGSDQSLKKFVYGKESALTGRGKLLRAVRRNDLTSGEVDVTEDYEYNEAAGQMSKRKTLVERVNGGTRQSVQQFEYSLTYDDLLLPKTITMPVCTLPGSPCAVDKAITSVTNNRAAGYLTSIDGFATSMTYHPSGMVESVVHDTLQKPADRYSIRNGIPRPSKISFMACADAQPYFLPGPVVVKTNVNGSCGLQVSWPPAVICGGGGNIKYDVLRDNQPLAGASGLTSPKFLDPTAHEGTTYTYKITASGPPSDTGTTLTVTLPTASGKMGSCTAQTILTVPAVQASVGVPATFRATLSSSNGPAQDEALTFSVRGEVIGTVRTAADGSAVITHAVEAEPMLYANAIKVTYAGGVLPANEATANLTTVCGLASYIVKPITLNVLPVVGAYPIFVGTSTHCTWSPLPDAGFLDVDSRETKKGTGTFKIAVPAYSEPDARNSIVHVGNQNISVQQSGVASACTYRFVPEIAYIPAESNVGIVSMDIATQAGCSWTVSTDSLPWMHFQNPPHDTQRSATSDTGPRTIYFTVDPHTDTVKRSAELSLRDSASKLVATGHVNQDAQKLAVPPGPLVEDLRDGSVSDGQNIPLRVYTDVGTQLRYEWYINDFRVQGCEQCPERTFHPYDAGYPPTGQSATYQVRVVNNAGEVTSNKVTWFNSGHTVGSCNVPFIEDSLLRGTSPSDALSPRPGASLQLFVVGLHADFNDTDPTFTYKWYRGISGDRSSLIPHNPNDLVDTITVSPFNTSFYWVEVSDHCGAQQSRTAMVTVTAGPPARRRAASHDFTGDGKSDLVWHNTATAQNEVWSMSAMTHTGTIALPANADPKAQIQSTGDLDADGKTDLVWRDPETGHNEAWLMNQTNLGEIRPLESRNDPHWTIGAVGDYDNDNNDDIVWHNSATGENQMWFQSGTDHSGSWALPSNTSAQWGLYGGGDFNSDEKPDLFFHDRSTGENSIWIMDDATRAVVASTGTVSASMVRGKLHVSTLSLPAMTDLNWVPALVADMDGDGRPDIVWRNSVTGENSVWIMSGTILAQTITLEPRTDLNWQIGGGGSSNSGDTGSGGGGTPSHTATSIGVAIDPVSVGKPAAVTATLTAGSTPIAQHQLVFSLSGTEVARLLTDSAGSATTVIDPGSRAAGTYGDAISVRFDGDDVYDASSKTADLVISAEPVAVTWNDPAPVIYGTPLSPVQLNATASVPGTFAYTPGEGEILGAGYRTLRVTFTPNDPAIAPVTKTAVLLVVKSPLSVSWAAPSSISYGTPLSALQLNAISTVPGTFTYSPDPGTILPVGNSQTLTVTFEPDSADYDMATATTTIDVTRGAQTILWNDPASMTTLQSLGSLQLNATVIPSGTTPAGQVTYTPPAGTFLDPGVQELRVTVAATAYYEAASATVDVFVTRARPIVQWTTPSPIVYGTPLSAAQLNASASVPGTFAYVPSEGATLDAGTQPLWLVFIADDPRYEAVVSTVQLQVTKAPQTITWSNPAPIVYGTPLSQTQLNARVTISGPASNGIVFYTPSAGTILSSGAAQTLTVTVDATDNYDGATASVAIDVLKATPEITWQNPAPIVYGTPLGVTQLSATANVNGTFDYAPPAGTILNAGSGQTLATHFTPADAHNYNSADAASTIDVAKAKQSIHWTAPSPVVYGTPLSSAQLNASVGVAGPSPAGALTYAPAGATVLNAGTGQTLSVTAAETPNYDSATASVALDVRPAPLSLRVDPKSKPYGAALPTLTGTLTGIVNSDPITPSYSTPATQQSAAGSYPINGALIDPNHRLANYDVTITPAAITIAPSPLSITANPASKQYSDPIPALTATFTGFVPGETPAVLNGTLLIQTTAAARSAPGTYAITVGGLTSPNYAITYSGSTLTVTPEDARIVITSPRLVSASATGTTSITLTATIQDISATANAAGDVDPGDIRKATLTFVDRGTGAVLCTAPIALVNDADERVATGTCTFSRSFGTTLPAPASLVAGARAGGYYIRDAAADDATMSVTAPTVDSITGGGSIDITSSAGLRAPDRTSRGKFDVNLQYDKNNAIKGSFTFTFVRTEQGVVRQYELTAASIGSLSIRRTPSGGVASIIGNALLRDLTVKSSPVTIVDGAPLIVTATDAGEPSANDAMNIIVFKQDGGLWLAAGWNGIQPVDQKVSDGNLQVHYGN